MEKDGFHPHTKYTKKIHSKSIKPNNTIFGNHKEKNRMLRDIDYGIYNKNGKIEMLPCRGCGANTIWGWDTAGLCNRCRNGKKMVWEGTPPDGRPKTIERAGKVYHYDPNHTTKFNMYRDKFGHILGDPDYVFTPSLTAN